MNIYTASTNIFTIDSFLTKNQCNEFIHQAEAVGFKSADVDIGGARSLLTSIRNNQRVDVVSDELAVDWWSKVDFSKLPAIDGKNAVGLSPRFRFYKYSPGQKFNMHKDGRQDVNGGKTMFTLLVYLNENYTGGNTIFRQDKLAVAATTGKALIFEHHLWHQGSQVESGIKYVMRTDIVCKS